MSDSKFYIENRKKSDPEFAENYEEGYQEFKENINNFKPKIRDIQQTEDWELVGMESYSDGKLMPICQLLTAYRSGSILMVKDDKKITKLVVIEEKPINFVKED